MFLHPGFWFCFLLFGVILALILALILGTQKHTFHNLKAEILCINEKIFDGSWEGMFLGSSSGKFQNDTIKVGIKIIVGEQMFLKDIQLQHSELIYFTRDGQKEIPLNVEFTSFPQGGIQGDLTFLLNDRPVGYVRCHKDLAERIKRTIPNK